MRDIIKYDINYIIIVSFGQFELIDHNLCGFI
jgi:hypothetical protein